MTDSEKRTLVAIKLRASRTLRDLWVLFAIIGGFGLLLAGLGACQTFVCTQTRADLTWGRCWDRTLGRGP